MADPGFHGWIGEEGQRATVRGANSRREGGGGVIPIIWNIYWRKLHEN